MVRAALVGHGFKFADYCVRLAEVPEAVVAPPTFPAVAPPDRQGAVIISTSLPMLIVQALEAGRSRATDIVEFVCQRADTSKRSIYQALSKEKKYRKPRWVKVTKGWGTPYSLSTEAGEGEELGSRFTTG